MFGSYGYPPDSDRRVKTLHVASSALIALFQQDGSKQLRFEGMPEDASVVGVGWDVGEEKLYLKIKSGEFDVCDGDPPELELKVTEIEPHKVKFREFF